MKSKIIGITLLTLLSTSAFSAAFYCQVENRPVDVLSEQGHFDCLDAFAEGNICYVGPRAEALKVLKDLQDTDFNWDEEWIEDIHFKGKNEISYDFVDGPNDLRSSLSMKPCR